MARSRTIIVAVTLLLLVALLAACGQEPLEPPGPGGAAAAGADATTTTPASAGAQEPAPTATPAPAGSDPGQVVLAFWDAFRADDREAAARYLAMDPDSDEFPDLWASEDDGEIAHDLEEIFLGEMYLGRIVLAVDGHRMDGQQATVEAVVTWPDPAVFLLEFVTLVFGIMFDEEMSEMSEEELDALLASHLVDILANTPDISTPFETTLVLVDGEWKLTGIPLPDLTEDLEFDFEQEFEFEFDMDDPYSY